jgi:hypothetical protein
MKDSVEAHVETKRPVPCRSPSLVFPESLNPANQMAGINQGLKAPKEKGYVPRAEDKITSCS